MPASPFRIPEPIAGTDAADYLVDVARAFETWANAYATPDTAPVPDPEPEAFHGEAHYRPSWCDDQQELSLIADGDEVWIHLGRRLGSTSFFVRDLVEFGAWLTTAAEIVRRRDEEA